ncbi:MAG: alkaline phytoceramidase [Limisphaerales bacterium]
MVQPVLDLQQTFRLRGPLKPLGNSRRRDRNVWLFAMVALAGIVTALLLPPLRQLQSYHHFADARTLAGVPNCLNVISNVAFLGVGILGLGFLASPGQFLEPRERIPYAFFFLGVTCTCYGSVYYHWRPSDATLVWDRLPMTVAFMSLLAAMIAERVSVAAGLRLLLPLLMLGAGTVWWWQWTGNLWPYMAAQYFPILLIGLLMVGFPPRYTRSGDMLAVVGWYALAKVAEAMDARIYALGGWVSGHTIKHLIAAVAAYWVLRMLNRRSPLGSLARVASSPRPRIPLF